MHYSLYYLNGQGIIQERCPNGDILSYVHDESGNVVAFEHYSAGENKISFYYYIRNLQGDIIAVTDRVGNIVKEYTYDAWGKVLSVTGSLASTVGQANPYRYRGYYYDTETGFYYLQSRYYDPETARFLNADGILGANQDILSYNLFAYCSNNPINFSDPTGESILGAIASGLKSFLTIAAITTCAVLIINSITPQGRKANEEFAKSISKAISGATAATAQGVRNFAKDYNVSKSDSRTKEKTVTKTAPKNTTVIYRYGGTNPGNLTPSNRDVELYPQTGKGLSFSTIPKPGAAMTTIEALNATGVVYAVNDGFGHVSVHPVGGTLQDWYNSGSSSVWTQAVKSVVIKWDGGN